MSKNHHPGSATGIDLAEDEIHEIAMKAGACDADTLECAKRAVVIALARATPQHPEASADGDDVEQRTEKIRLAHANPVGRSRTHLIRDAAHLLAHIALLRSATPQHPEAKPLAWMVGDELYNSYDEIPDTHLPPYWYPTALIAAPTAAAATPQHSVTEQALRDGYMGSTMVSDFAGPKITIRYSTTAQADAAHAALCAMIDAHPLASTAATCGNSHQSPYESVHQPVLGVGAAIITAATQPEQASVKTWQERLAPAVSPKAGPMGAIERAMADEISDLRAALAIPASTAASEQQASVSELPPLLEMESLADIEYAQCTPDDWDADYRATWQKLQVAERNKMQWRAYALQLRTALSGRATIPSEADERAADGETIDQKAENALLWCYRRLKNSYGRLPFVEEAVAGLRARAATPDTATTAADQQGDTASASGGPDQAAFEAQARYQGAKDFTPVHPEFLVCNNGWTPATYRDPMTELAWRVWANKSAQQGAAQAQAGEDADWKGFALSILIDARDNLGSDVDGGIVQDCATECGLLVKVTAQESCGENCACADSGDFPQDCYRYSKATYKAIRENAERAAMAAKAASNGENNA